RRTAVAPVGTDEDFGLLDREAALSAERGVHISERLAEGRPLGERILLRAGVNRKRAGREHGGGGRGRSSELRHGASFERMTSREILLRRGRAVRQDVPASC